MNDVTVEYDYTYPFISINYETRIVTVHLNSASSTLLTNLTDDELCEIIIPDATSMTLVNNEILVRMLRRIR